MRMATRQTIRILGIDPALRCTGYGVIDTDGRNYKALDCGVITTPPKRPLSECLTRLNRGIRELLDSFEPDVTAIEGGFFAKNAKTAMILGSARGAVIAPVAEAGVTIYEYAPRRIKQAICGHGNASKEQIANLVKQMLALTNQKIRSDATDALAIAICHANTCFTNQGVFLPEPI